MENKWMMAPLALATLACAACTDDTGDESDGHLLESQQQAIQRARDVETDVAEAAQRRDQRIEDSENDG